MHQELAAWKPRLTEGMTYYIRNFKVHDNNTGYRMTPHKYRLTVVSATRLNAVDVCNIPKTYFRFKDFAEIHDGKFDPNLVVGKYNITPACMFFETIKLKIQSVLTTRTCSFLDAIGVVNDIGKCVTATPTRKGQAVFTLKDNRLECSYKFHAISVTIV
jgi:hypothetical protein